MGNTVTTVAWVLNLDADLELADPVHHSPSPRLVQQTVKQAERLLAIANERGAPQVRHVPMALSVEATACQSWCPTPRARATAYTMGWQLPPSPPLEVLQRVNHRGFVSGYRSQLPGAAFVRSMAELDAVLAADKPAGGWLLKRPFGFSGRGRKRVSSVLEGADRRWAAASMVEYGCGLQVEPFVAIDREFALHSWVSARGDCLTGRPTRLLTDASGAWLGSELAGQELHEGERHQLAMAHAAAASALHQAGYFGPFATDAFRWLDEAGHAHFQPQSELNARYTMGFFVGLDDRQEEWLARIRE